MCERRYKLGLNRRQAMLLPPSVDDYVSEDSLARAIDIDVDTLDLAALGFRHAEGGLTPGQPAYAPAHLLKLYLYGYLNRIRSSRRLQAEAERNLEIIWLLEGLRPGYRTIAEFRRTNAKGNFSKTHGVAEAASARSRIRSGNSGTVPSCLMRSPR